MNFVVPTDDRVKLKEGEKKDKYQDLVREVKNKKVTVLPIVICMLYNQQRICIGTERIGKKRTRGDHPNHSTFEISQNTEKSHGHLRRLIVSENLVKDHQLKVV